MSVITTVEQLEAIYGVTNDASTVKVADHVTPLYRIFIEKAPFAALATIGPEGIDCSPRGDLPGFVRIHDPKTLMLPDRRGNNRVDSLRNIVRDPRVSLMFLIPGSGNATRVNGRAHLSIDPESLGLVQGRRQSAAQRHGDEGRRDLLPMRPCHRALRPLESRQAR